MIVYATQSVVFGNVRVNANDPVDTETEPGIAIFAVEDGVNMKFFTETPPTSEAAADEVVNTKSK
jgi:hypothetical protein